MIEHDAQAGKPLKHVLNRRDAVGRHLQADGKAGIFGLAPGGERPRIVEPAGLTGHGAAGREQPQARQAAVHPIRHRVARIGCQDVAREDAGEPAGVSGYRIRHVRVVVPVAGRRLDERSLADASAVLLDDQLLDADRSLPGPRRLMAAKRGARIPRGIGGDHVGVDVDDRNVHDECSLRRDNAPDGG
jgi:hypothetical protein